MTDTPETETGAAFAAGVATAEAANASDEAAEAVLRAEIAQERAEGAERVAGEAVEASWATRDALADMAAQFRGDIDALRELITSQAEGGHGGGRGSAGDDAATGAGAVPAPERKEETPAPVVEDDGKPKRRSGYGSQTWFGNR